MKFRIPNLFLLYFPFLLLSLNAAGQTAGNAADSLSLVAAMNTFVDAFSGLNWPVFDACFADDATAFFPLSAKFPYRANGKQEIENIFKVVFENARKRNPVSPHIEIQPREIKIQMLGSTVITSFLLTDPDLLGRRTIVWKKQQDKWLIVHLHASGCHYLNKCVFGIRLCLPLIQLNYIVNDAPVLLSCSGYAVGPLVTHRGWF